MADNAVQVVKQRVALDRDALVDLRERLAHARLPAPLLSGWEQGASVPWLQELLDAWSAFDFDALQARLDSLTHLRADVGEQSLHLVHAPGRGPDPVPLLLTHGWPGSFFEHLAMLSRLSDPGAHDSNPNQSFSVVVPSLPGFGFSGPPPPQGLDHRSVAALWHRLMTEGLGYHRYVAHGSDLGAGVTAWLARDRPDAVAGIHLATPGLPVPSGPRSPAEAAYADALQVWTRNEGGYSHEHGTKPATLAAALNDSPAGLAAWIGEKIHTWSSTRADGQTIERDFLLATLTLYWTTGTISTSLLPYWASSDKSGGAELPLDRPSPVSTAVSIFGGERVPFPKPPRSLTERFYRVTDWAEHAVGGHFPGVTEPEFLAHTLRQTLHPLLHPAAPDL